MKVAILQPSYIPWRGYFHQIAKVDLFIFYDDVQYDKHGWRNRNRIKTANGPIWLTIPVLTSGVVSGHVPIREVHISPTEKWSAKHWMTIQQSYKRAPFFARYAPLLESALRSPPPLLADFTIDLTVALARALGLEKTQFLRSSSLSAQGQKTDRLIEILTHVGARHYVSGPSARDYIEPEKFERAGITVEYMVYDYPEYPQLHGAYDPQVSIIDLLFSVGPDALRYFER